MSVSGENETNLPDIPESLITDSVRAAIDDIRRIDNESSIIFAAHFSLFGGDFCTGNTGKPLPTLPDSTDDVPVSLRLSNKRYLVQSYGEEVGVVDKCVFMPAEGAQSEVDGRNIQARIDKFRHLEINFSDIFSRIDTDDRNTALRELVSEFPGIDFCLDTRLPESNEPFSNARCRFVLNRGSCDIKGIRLTIDPADYQIQAVRTKSDTGEPGIAYFTQRGEVLFLKGTKTRSFFDPEGKPISGMFVDAIEELDTFVAEDIVARASHEDPKGLVRAVIQSLRNDGLNPDLVFGLYGESGDPEQNPLLQGEGKRVNARRLHRGFLRKLSTYWIKIPKS